MTTEPSGRASNGSGGPPKRQVELAAGGQDRVAHDLGLQPPQRHAPQQVDCPGRPRSRRRRAGCGAARRSDSPTPGDRRPTVTISLTSGLTAPPSATNWQASQSSSSGCVGSAPETPKFSDVSTMPRPNRCCQTRLTMTRAARPPAGDFQSVSQRASARRRPLVAPAGASSAADSAGRRLRVGRAQHAARSRARLRARASRGCRAEQVRDRRRPDVVGGLNRAPGAARVGSAAATAPVEVGQLLSSGVVKRARDLLGARPRALALNFSARYFCTSVRLSAARLQRRLRRRRGSARAAVASFVFEERARDAGRRIVGLLRFELGDLLVDLGVVLFGLGLCGAARCRPGPGSWAAASAAGLNAGVKAANSAVVVALRDRLVLVIVALGAAERQAQQVVGHDLAGALQHAVAGCRAWSAPSRRCRRPRCAGSRWRSAALRSRA